MYELSVKTIKHPHSKKEFYSKNDDDKAFTYFEKAYLLEPENNESLYNMGAYYLKKGDREKARPFIKRAYEFGNKSAIKYLSY